MKNTLLFLFLLAPLLLCAQTINSTHSYVSFSAKNMEVKTVKGTFSDMQGEIHWNENDPSKIKMQACVSANTVTTGTTRRDEHLKESDFFDVENYPNICFNAIKVEKKDQVWIAHGNLTIKNITKEIAIPFTYAKRIFTGNFTLNRFDYDLGKDSNTFMIGEEIEITIKCLINN